VDHTTAEFVLTERKTEFAMLGIVWVRMFDRNGQRMAILR